MGKALATLAAAVALISGSARADGPAISKVIVDIAAGADRLDWARVRQAFDENVVTDYSSLWGGAPVSHSAYELVASWAAFLTGFDSTHHMVTNHAVVSVEGTEAVAEADFTATHRIDDQLWVLGGRYAYTLVMIEGRWRATSMTMTAL